MNESSLIEIGLNEGKRKDWKKTRSHFFPTLMAFKFDGERQEKFCLTRSALEFVDSTWVIKLDFCFFLVRQSLRKNIPHVASVVILSHSFIFLYLFFSFIRFLSSIYSLTSVQMNFFYSNSLFSLIFLFFFFFSFQFSFSAGGLT